MKSIISLVLSTVLFISALACNSCTSTSGTGSGISGAVSSAQSWLTDPKNIALIQQIAADAVSAAALFGKRGATSNAAVVGNLASKYPDVPAGALAKIAANPDAYAKK